MGKARKVARKFDKEVYQKFGPRSIKTGYESITGQRSSERATKRSAAAMNRATNEAVAEQQAAREQISQQTQPYREFGAGTLPLIAGTIGQLGGVTQGLPQAQLQPLGNLPEAQLGQLGQLPQLEVQARNMPGLAMSSNAGLPQIGPSDYSQLQSLAMSDLSGLPNVNPADIGQDSLFQSLKREAISGIESSAAARGKLFSGQTPQAMAEKIQNLALSRAGDIQRQNLAARQQFMGERGQLYGESLGARQQGFNEMNQQFGQSLASRQQLMGEQGQMFGESLAGRQLYGNEQQQEFQRASTARQQMIGERGQLYGQDLAARQAAIGERGDIFQQDLAARQALLGERMGLQGTQYQQLLNAAQMGQAAVANQAANLQGAAANIGELYAQQANAYSAAQMAQANQRAAMFQGLLGAGATGLGAYAALSDRRMKEDINQVGTLDSGLPVYTFRYKGQPTVHMGVMAQDVEKVNPDAVVEIDGIKHVYYGEL